MDIKAIVLDMDGTIFDTEKLIIDTFVTLFKNYSIDLAQNEKEWLIGKTTDEIVEFAKLKIGNENIDNFVKENKYLFCNYIKEFGTPLKNGAKELIMYVKQNGLKLALATSAIKDIVEFNFKHSALSLNDFDIVCTLDDVKKGKPDSEIYEKVAQRLGLDPNKCIAIEDSYVGITSAKNAGLTTIKVKDLEKVDKEKDKFVDFKFLNLLEVIDYLKLVQNESQSNN